MLSERFLYAGWNEQRSAINYPTKMYVHVSKILSMIIWPQLFLENGAFIFWKNDGVIWSQKFSITDSWQEEFQ